MKLNERICFFLLTFLSFFVRRLTPRDRTIWAQRIGGFVFHYISLRKSVALQNIDRAFPNKSIDFKLQTLKRSYSFFIEQFLFFLGFPESYQQIKMEIKNKDILDEAIGKRRGVLFITGHFGFWEGIVAWFGKNNYPLTGIAQRQKNEGAHHFFIKKREWSGIKHVFRKDQVNSFNKVLENGEILGLVSDQDARHKGVFVKFFGIPSSTPKGAALFYHQKGSIPVFAVCSKKGYNQFLIKFMKIPEELLSDTFTFTQAYTQMLENEIRQHPDQYFWWHKRWKTLPPK